MTEKLTPAEQVERALNPRKPLVIRLLKWRYVIPFTVLLILVMAPFVYRSYLLSQVPDIGDPFDVEAFGTVSLDEGTNALADYEAAMSLLTPEPSRTVNGDELGHALEKGWTSASPAVRTWLNNNRAAMERWKIGSEKSDFLYYQPKDLGIGLLLPVIQELRTFTLLSQLETSRLLSEDKPAEAWIWARTTVRCSRHLGQHGAAIERLVGIALYTVAVEAMIVPIADHPATTEALIHEMLKEIQEQYAKTPPESTALKCEYLMFMSTMGDPDLMRLGATGDGLNAMYHAYRLSGIEPELSRRVARQYWTNVLEQIDLPVHQRQRQTGTLGLFQHDPAKPHPPARLAPAEIEAYCMKSLFARMMPPATSAFDMACRREASKHGAIELLLAVKIYRLRHGQFPADAEALVAEGLLKAIPIDPFSTTGEKMKYRRSGDEAVVYSIGHDGIDDGRVYIGTDGRDTTKDIGLILGRKTDDSVEAQKPDSQ